MTLDLIFKTRDKLAGTQCQAEIVRFAARKRVAVYGSFKINHGDIALLGFAVFNRNHPGIAVLNPGDFIVYVLIRHADRFFQRGDPFVSFHLNFRFCCDGGIEHKAVFAGGNEIEINLVFNHLKVCFADCLFQCPWIKRIDGIIVENLFPIVFFNKLARCFSPAETRDGDFFILFTVSLLDGFFKLIGIDRYFQPKAVRSDLVG